MSSAKKLLTVLGSKGFVTKITPIYGAELLTNEGFETGSPPTDWSGIFANLTTQTDARPGSAGTKCIRVARNGGNYPRATQAITTVVGTWYKLDGWIKNNDAVGGGLDLSDVSSGVIWAGSGVPAITVMDWTFQSITGYALDVDGRAQVVTSADGKADGVYAQYDDLTLKTITLNTCFKSLRMTPNGNVDACAYLTLSAGVQGGVVINLDSITTPVNFVLAFIDGIKAYLLKCVAGTYTSLIATAITYVAGAKLQVTKSATTYKLYYNGSQVGTDQTIADAGIVDNTNHYQFATSNLVSFGGYTVRPFDYGVDGAYALHAETALDITTYDGSGECTHPDVLYFSNKWNDKYYWMVMTPYPSSNADYENPSILSSDDGTTWIVPSGLTNPIDPKPETSFNADPDITMVGNTLWCLWRWSTKVMGRSSTDGVVWSDEVEIANIVIASPAIVYHNEKYLMFGVNPDTTPNTIIKYSADAITGQWSEGSTVTCALAAGEPWHLDVISDGSILYMMVVTLDNGKLYLASSIDDGDTWTVASRSVMPAISGTWDQGFYRPSIIRTSYGFDMFYGGISPLNVFKIGRTSVKMM